MYRTYYRNLGQRSILASVLNQNKALHNFPKRGLRLTVERNIGLAYALNDQTHFQNPAM